MKVAIMQPYFLPYIGYFQLINAVDVFVIYDNIQFSKKGWFHRNRMLVNGKDEYFTLPLKKDSDYLNVNQRYLSENWSEEKAKLLRKIKENYRKAPFFGDVYEYVETIFENPTNNLFEFLHHSVLKITDLLDIKTSIIKSSELSINHELKNQEKVIALCKSLNATQYINPIGGLELYDTASFNEHKIKLDFLKTKSIVYNQFSNEFVPWLSILDVLMFNELKVVKDWLSEFYLHQNTIKNE